MSSCPYKKRWLASSRQRFGSAKWILCRLGSFCSIAGSSRRGGFSIGVKIALDPTRIGMILGQMQTTASLPADQFDELLRRLPTNLDLDSLARETRAIERKRVVGSGADLLRLALGRGPGGLSLSETAAWASLRAGAERGEP